MKQGFLILPGFILMSACSTPDLTPGLSSAKALLDTSKAEYEKTYRPIANEELKAAQDQAFRDNKPVAQLQGCTEIFLDELSLEASEAAVAANPVLARCELISTIVLPSSKVTATSFLAALDALQGYFDALIILADGKSVQEVKTNFGLLIDALAAKGADGTVLFGRVGELAGGQKDVTSRVVGFSLEQYKVTRLREIMIKGEDLIKDFVDIAKPYLASKNDDLLKKHEALTQAHSDLNASTGVAEGRVRLRKLKTAFDAYKKAEAESSLKPIVAIQKMHRNLLGQLNGKVEPKDVSDTFGEISELLVILEKEN